MLTHLRFAMFNFVVHHAYFSCMLCLQVFTVLNINLTTLSMLILFLFKNINFWRDHEPVGSGRVGNLAGLVTKV